MNPISLLSFCKGMIHVNNGPTSLLCCCTGQGCIKELVNIAFNRKQVQKQPVPLLTGPQFYEPSAFHQALLNPSFGILVIGHALPSNSTVYTPAHPPITSNSKVHTEISGM